MKRQVVCYVRRSLISDWKRKVLTHEERAFIFGDNDDRVFKCLREGDIIWVVSPVPDHPPELVARIEVELVAPRGHKDLDVGEKLQGYFRRFKWIARGGPNSCFFGHNNAGQAMLKTIFVNPASGLRWRLADLSPQWKGEFGKRFIRPYQICNDEIPGSSFLEQITKLPTVFISWKQMDHQVETILSLAYALADKGFMPWLDLLAMPDSISLKKAQKHPDELNELLKYGYQHSSILLAVESKHYGEQSARSNSNWTLREWEGDLASNSGIDRFVFRPPYSSPSKMLPDSVIRLQSRTSQEAAEELWKLTGGM